MIFYGLADYAVDEIIEFYATKEDAQVALRQVLEDEPQWKPILGIETVNFGATPDAATYN